ncbi:MAG: phosphatase [Kordiimonadales bacterium]|nr:MAG: phosphatase [Kordiimonadales bacterium]
MSKSLNRRNFLSGAAKTTATLTLGGSLLYLAGCSKPIQRPDLNLVKDPAGLCDLPKGFRYTVISKAEETMSDGYIVPDYHDGMGCFEGPNGALILVRNHEVPLYFPFDPASPAPDFAYDPTSSGGTTTIWLDDNLAVTRHHLSLTGTIRNCSGGKTPWQTWISSEEPGSPGWGSGWQMGKRHGYNFEVDPLKPLQLAQPLKAMGRFNHEAVAIDPASGIAYQTEDSSYGCFYRFLPTKAGHLAEGGTLQALKFVDGAINHTTKHPLQSGEKYLCTWVTVAEPDPEDNTVHLQAQKKGAAIFVRGEGLAVHDDGIYFSCTTGGAAGMGQIFKYVPGPGHGNGTIELVYEAKVRSILEKPDNITLNQWGDLIICEDNSLDTQCLVGLTPEGKIYYIAANTQSEWSGACFSPNGKILFANIHKGPGMTLAIQGPWEALRQTA